MRDRYVRETLDTDDDQALIGQVSSRGFYYVNGLADRPGKQEEQHAAAGRGRRPGHDVRGREERGIRIWV